MDSPLDRGDRAHVYQLPMVSAMYKCLKCHDTGKVGASQHLDCAYCDVAEKRVKLNAAVEALQAIGEAPEDIWWNVWQMSADDAKKAWVAYRDADMDKRQAEAAASQRGQGIMNQLQQSQMPYLNNSSNLAACYGYLNQLPLPTLQTWTIPADLDAVRWAVSVLNGEPQQNGNMHQIMMERLQAMLRKV